MLGLMMDARPKKSNTLTYILIGISASCILLCGIGGFQAFRGVQNAVGQVGPILVCTTEITAARNALMAYAKKNGKFPEGAGWRKAVEPFYAAEIQKLKQEEFGGRPEDNPVLNTLKWSDPTSVWGCRVEEGKVNAFAMNIDVAGKPVADVQKNESLVLLFETPNAENKAEAFKPRTDQTGPRVFGELRDWMRINVVGEAIGGRIERNRNGARLEINPGSDEPGSGETSNQGENAAAPTTRL